MNYFKNGEEVHEVIVGGIRYVPEKPVLKEKYWEIESFYHVDQKGKRKREKRIYSVIKKSNRELFTIGDTIALTWYPTFWTPHIIKEFIVDGNEIYLRYDEKSMWALSNSRTVTLDEIYKVIMSIGK